MPLYSYKCVACEHTFDEVLKIDDRRRPCDEDCPSCDSRGHISMVVSTARIVAGVGNLHSKTSNNFRDRMKEIKKLAGRQSTIEV